MSVHQVVLGVDYEPAFELDIMSQDNVHVTSLQLPVQSWLAAKIKFLFKGTKKFITGLMSVVVLELPLYDVQTFQIMLEESSLKLIGISHLTVNLIELQTMIQQDTFEGAIIDVSSLICKADKVCAVDGMKILMPELGGIEGAIDSQRLENGLCYFVT